VCPPETHGPLLKVQRVQENLKIQGFTCTSTDSPHVESYSSLTVADPSTGTEVLPLYKFTCLEENVSYLYDFGVGRDS
jgi:hypothetical protein